MVDKISKKHRSWNMARIRSKDTSPERKVRSILHSHGYRFRLRPRMLPGKPDIILKKYKSVIFVHGCFWHRHPACKYAYTPKSRIEFWEKKFCENVKRDKHVSRVLKKLGWNVIVVWECELSNPDALTAKLKKHLV